MPIVSTSTGIIGFDRERMFQERRSEMTILRAVEPSIESQQLSPFYLEDLLADTGETWSNRQEFIITTVLVCSGMSNAWIFGAQLLSNGGAAFFYLYFIFTLMIGAPLLFFEVGLGQYAKGKFVKTFSMCPILEGLTSAMGIYCLLANTIFNRLNSVNLQFMFLALTDEVPFRRVSDNGTDYEHLINVFNNTISITHDVDGSPIFNFKALGILFFLWCMIPLIIVKDVFSNAKVTTAIFIISMSSLIFTVLVTVCLPCGCVWDGLKYMFVPTWRHFQNLKTWYYAIQQAVFGYGFGLGPLIRIGTKLKFGSPADIDCFLASIFALLESIIFGIIVSITVTRITTEHERFYGEHRDGYSKGTNVHVMLLDLFGRIPNGLTQVTMFVCLLGFFLASLYCAVEYTKIVVLVAAKVLCGLKIRMPCVLVFVCVFSFILGALIINEFNLVIVATTVLLGPACLLIVTFELLAIVYLYQLYNYCDDLEFVLGFAPGLFSQLLWLGLPLVLTVTVMIGLFLIRHDFRHPYNWHFLIITVALILLPIIMRSLYNLFDLVIKNGCSNWKEFFGMSLKTSSSDSFQSEGTLARYFSDLEKRLGRDGAMYTQSSFKNLRK